MSSPADIEIWLRQARADLRAGASTGSGTYPCHRRYWLQQACEKGTKALGQLLWSSKNDKDAQTAFEKLFLGQHSPLLELDRRVHGSTPPPAAILRLHGQIQAELARIDRNGVLKKVDSTKPSRNADDISYRYPFRNASALHAPCDWKATQWDAYQGNRRAVVRAVERLIEVVTNRARLPGPP